MGCRGSPRGGRRQAGRRPAGDPRWPTRLSTLDSRLSTLDLTLLDSTCTAGDPRWLPRVPSVGGCVARGGSAADARECEDGARGGRQQDPAVGQDLDPCRQPRDQRDDAPPRAAKGARGDPELCQVVAGGHRPRGSGRREADAGEGGRVRAARRRHVAGPRAPRELRERPQGAQQGAREDPDRAADLDHGFQARGGQWQPRACRPYHREGNQVTHTAPDLPGARAVAAGG